MLNLDEILIRDESPNISIYVQDYTPDMINGDIWHATISHRTYMSVEGVPGKDPGFNSIVEVTAFGDCKRYNCESAPQSAPPPEPCSGLCLTGHDIGVPSNEIAYAHPECGAHSCTGQCSPPVYHVDCPAHGRKPSQSD